MLVKIPYIVAEAPSNLLIKRLLPSRWQSRIMVSSLNVSSRSKSLMLLRLPGAFHWRVMQLLRTNKDYTLRGSFLDWYVLGYFLSPYNKHFLEAFVNISAQFEAGMFPGVILQMCYWYRPDEMSLRLLYFCRFCSILALIYTHM